MSIQDFFATGEGLDVEITYEQLYQQVKDMQKQTKKTSQAKDEFLAVPTIGKYKALEKTWNLQNQKLQQFKDDLAKLNGQENDLVVPISEDLTEIAQLLARVKETIDSERKKVEQMVVDEEEMLRKEEEDRKKTQAQLEAEYQAREAEALDQGAKEIVTAMQDTLDVTNQLNENLDKQHEQIQRIETTVEDAHQEMVEGNADLEEAQEHQKSTSKCMYYIIGGVILGIIVIVLIILGALGVF